MFNKMMLVLALFVGVALINNDANAQYNNNFNAVRVGNNRVFVLANTNHVNAQNNFFVDRNGVVRDRFGRAVRDRVGNVVFVRNGAFVINNQRVFLRLGNGAFLALEDNNSWNNNNLRRNNLAFVLLRRNLALRFVF